MHLMADSAPYQQALPSLITPSCHSTTEHHPGSIDHPPTDQSSWPPSPPSDAVHPTLLPLELHNDTVTGILGRTPEE